MLNHSLIEKYIWMLVEFQGTLNYNKLNRCQNEKR